MGKFRNAFELLMDRPWPFLRLLEFFQFLFCPFVSIRRALDSRTMTFHLPKQQQRNIADMKMSIRKKKRDTNRTERITSDECKEKKQNAGELPRLKIPILGCGSWMWVYTWRGIFPQMDMWQRQISARAIERNSSTSINWMHTMGRLNGCSIPRQYNGFVFMKSHPLSSPVNFSLLLFHNCFIPVYCLKKNRDFFLASL